ncbi:YkoF-like protein [Crassisporium funariophilum]|nr:YkoF-like protein [Crassisporium funariophilum]
MSDLYAVAGTASTSVAEEVAECQRILAKSGLKYHVSHHHLSILIHTMLIVLSLQMHGYGTNIEGPWSKVSQAIHDCHAAVHAKGAQRIATDIRIGTRTDREITFGEGNDGKVKRVEGILAKDAT